MPEFAVLLDRLLKAMTFDDIAKICGRSLVVRGAVRLSYHHLPPLGAFDHVSSITVAAWNFPDEWVELYQNSNYWMIDPIPRVALTMARPFWWSETSQLVDLTQEQRDYLKALRQQRLGDGLAVPVFGPRGRSGYVGIGFKDDVRQPSEVMVARMQAICQMGHQRYCQILIGDGVAPQLSDREREVLTWMAAGKSNAVIAEITSLSSYTVDTYVRRLYAKLTTNDRVTAVLRGAALGLIE